MKRIGKIGEINLDARRKIATQCFEMGLEYCELNFPGCMHNFGVAPAHKERREFYRAKAFQHLLYDRSHWRVACQWCHSILDDRSKTSKQKSDSYFL